MKYLKLFDSYYIIEDEDSTMLVHSDDLDGISKSMWGKGEYTIRKKLDTDDYEESSKLYNKWFDDEEYLKEDIDIDLEEDWEEEDIDSPPISVGDKIFINEGIKYWSPHSTTMFFNVNGEWRETKLRIGNATVMKVKKSENINTDGKNSIRSGSIPYDGWLFMIDGHWPWFAYDEKFITKI